jgi:hypothetical protein
MDTNQKEKVSASSGKLFDACKNENPEQINERMRVAVGSIKENKTPNGNIAGVRQKGQGKLTAKQRLFASLVVEGNSQSDAYRKAYDVRTDNAAVIANSAYKLAQHPKVQRLLEQAISKRTETVLNDEVATRRLVMTALLDHAQNMKAESSKLRALELIGKAVGMFTDKVEQKVTEVSPDKLKEELSVHLALLDSLPTVPH